MIFLIITPHPFVFTNIIWDLDGWISGSNMSFCTYVFYIVFPYISVVDREAHFSINKVLPPT